ncbi:MAG: dienelactone hydrolase family protein [Gammaproteobacteria bacterium]|nr:dienelactone hydrolase family protein [Gammaproteobacteria bacterium]
MNTCARAASVLLLCGVGWVHAAVVGNEVSYKAGDSVLKGYLAFDDAVTTPRPGILVVHEWWGLNDYVRQRAQQLAGLGYVALAVDMYGEGKQAQHPSDANAFASMVRAKQTLARQRFEAGMKVLQQNPHTDKTKLAAIGYCFGGSVVLDMARQGVDLKAVVSFHGGLGTDKPAQKGKVKARILVLTGADDPMAKPAVVEKFKAEMQAAGAKFEVISYPGAKHSFTNPEADIVGKKFDLPLAYNQQADEDSWKRMQGLLQGVFK